MGRHPASEAAGKEPSATVNGTRGALGNQTRREDKPQGRERHPISRNMLCRTTQPHGPGVEAFAPGQRHAREDKKQQRIHQKIEQRLMLETRGEVFEEDVPLERHIAESDIGDGLDPSHENEQEPPEGQRHVHVSQQGVDPEDAPVKQRLADDLAHGFERPARGQAAQQPHLVAARKQPEPASPFPCQGEEHHRRAENERQTEGCVECHRQKSPSLRLISITTPRVLIPRGQTRRHLPHSMHLFISS